MGDSAEDVAAFGGRLQTVEQSLTHRMEVLTDLVSQSIEKASGSSFRSSSSSPEAFNDSTSSDVDDELASGLNSLVSSRTKPESPSIIVNDGPVERFYGESSTYAHLVHSRSLVEKLLTPGRHPDTGQNNQAQEVMRGLPITSDLANGAPSTFAEVQRKYDSFSGTSKFKEYFEIGDNRALRLPPRRELEDAIETYMAEQGLQPLLFHRQKLLDTVNAQYQGDGQASDESWALCFNNIILRSSAWKSRTFRMNSFATPSMEDKVLSLLLANANRALRQLEKFCVPRVVNVQALFLLVCQIRLRLVDDWLTLPGTHRSRFHSFQCF